MSKCLVLFVEGDTEVEFYKQVIANARKLRPNGMFDTNIECKSINGVGGFKNIVLRKFVKEIKTKYDEDCVFTFVLCRDEWYERKLLLRDTVNELLIANYRDLKTYSVY